jgi:hypothetical protein
MKAEIAKQARPVTFFRIRHLFFLHFSDTRRAYAKKNRLETPTGSIIKMYWPKCHYNFMASHPIARHTSYASCLYIDVLKKMLVCAPLEINMYAFH